MEFKTSILILVSHIYTISAYSQVIVKSEEASKFPKVMEINVPASDTGSIPFKKYYILSDSLKEVKVGRFIEYGNCGYINRIGYYSIKTDTFSLDSQTLIIFSNPNKHICIKLHYSLLKSDLGYSVSESGACNIVYGDNGIIEEECIEMPDCSIHIIYGIDEITYHVYKNMIRLNSYSIKRINH